MKDDDGRTGPVKVSGYGYICGFGTALVDLARNDWAMTVVTTTEFV